MKILKHPFGSYMTNCYIVKFHNFDILIDPGVNSMNWVIENVSNLKAILLTHGHFDHMWDLSKLKSHFKDVKIYCPKLDSFMIENDCFNLGLTPQSADIYINDNNDVNLLKINDVDIKYWHFPGHTPGCSIIQIMNHLFTGDFIFKGDVGRSDFPYSSRDDMKKSLIRFKSLNFKDDAYIHPGHGDDSTFLSEQDSVTHWINIINDRILRKSY